MSSSNKKQIRLSFTCFFLLRPSTDWTMPAHVGEGILFTQTAHAVLISSSQTHPEMSYQRVAQAS